MGSCGRRRGAIRAPCPRPHRGKDLAIDAGAAIRHYRYLFGRSWLRQSFAWTVILSDGKPIELSEIAAALSGGAPPEIWEETLRMALERFNMNLRHIIPMRSGSRVNLIEPGLPMAIATNFADGWARGAVSGLLPGTSKEGRA